MIQTYILRSDIPPLQAIKTREDSSICGNCKHRGFFGAGRTCYVQVHQAPTAIYNAYKRGSYTDITPLSYRQVISMIHDKAIRLGSYGDPAAVPQKVIWQLSQGAKRHTGYTHEWKNSPNIILDCMASVDSESEAKAAQDLGWRTFRVKNKSEPTLDNEVECPAVLKPGIITCESCKLCNGASSGKNVVLNVHGAKWKIDNFKEL